MFNFPYKKKSSKGSKNLVAKENILVNEIPEHVAIIMDGNGRWAKKRSLPRMAGHREGMKVVKKITKLASDIGIKVLTLYAFSTENWKRPKDEVNYLMRLPVEFLSTFLPELIQENVQVRVIGDQSMLPDYTVNAVKKAVNETKQNTGLILNFALNYGSRTEIVEAVKKILRDREDGKLHIDDIDEQLFSNYLMTKKLKDPDLLIRTSGEIRLSNFMLWQLAYTEFWFTDVLWPDFNEHHFLEAIREYQQRIRRFGGV
ncbi:isoprenyl transferase [Bacillaceae bacterium ZC4]|jgi:undecaprenyl diphosphate synthase|uniref:Isoprenyl transferase n=2 Tax=Aeribacillus TaxID=1055323 RepID=A0A165YZC2_9BACI|nr:MULTISPECIES: isoprenyl transferase [Aeribacillus]AXI39811.1 isoprenyl transferase [Bacillaceae bacterium ZC4]ASS91529.1 isoprenyl transferase [Aeribacillus pallidus]KZN97628.1 isoprenyl transferase [Aeribacillus pallidus]MDR9791917.1 isoprenyl transferase [Aeribacillus pallidus]MDR9795354.1 isoprenyl transferase [Aeribacillus pallidus]